MQRLEISGAVRPLYWPLDVKGLTNKVFTQFFLILVIDNEDKPGADFAQNGGRNKKCKQKLRQQKLPIL
jgi:hypothetical protein